MAAENKVQCCVVCAWRENCARKFSIPDGGARCVDFSRDISIKDPVKPESNEKSEGKGE